MQALFSYFHNFFLVGCLAGSEVVLLWCGCGSVRLCVALWQGQGCCVVFWSCLGLKSLCGGVLWLWWGLLWSGGSGVGSLGVSGCGSVWSLVWLWVGLVWCRVVGCCVVFWLSFWSGWVSGSVRCCRAVSGSLVVSGAVVQRGWIWWGVLVG